MAAWPTTTILPSGPTRQYEAPRADRTPTTDERFGISFDVGTLPQRVWYGAFDMMGKVSRMEHDYRRMVRTIPYALARTTTVETSAERSLRHGLDGHFVPRRCPWRFRLVDHGFWPMVVVLARNMSVLSEFKCDRKLQAYEPQPRPRRRTSIEAA